MADTTSGSAWPPRAFPIVVQFLDDRPAYFREVSGLDADTKATPYRHGGGDEHAHKTVMPNRPRFGIATFRRGLLATNSRFLKWCSQARTATVDRHTVTVQLLDESGAVTTTWILENAWPAKLPVTVDSGNETAVETIELALESIAQH